MTGGATFLVGSEPGSTGAVVVTGHFSYCRVGQDI